MAVYTVNTTVAQDTAVDYLLIKENVLRVAAGQSTLTKPQFVDLVFDQKCLDLVRQAQNTKMNDRVTRYQAVSPATAASADAILGVS